jgi:Cu(I)/Ag(I) efflux system membrane fusion protein
VHAPEAFQRQLGALYTAYLTLQESLAADDMESARAAAKTVSEALQSVDMELLEGKAHMAWMPLANSIKESLASLEASADLEAMRTPFEPIAGNLTEAIKLFGIQDGPPVYVAHCPMALDGEGANWLQKDTEVNNPYFGSAMLRCGEIVEQVEAGPAHEH